MLLVFFNVNRPATHNNNRATTRLILPTSSILYRNGLHSLYLLDGVFICPRLVERDHRYISPFSNLTPISFVGVKQPLEFPVSIEICKYSIFANSPY